MQHEITRAVPLLDSKGNLTEPGYAKRLLPIYERSAVRGGFARLKEWDYYYVGNDRFGVALTVADNSYMGLDSVSFLRFEGTPWQTTKSPMRVFPMGKTGLPATSAATENMLFYKGKAHKLSEVRFNIPMKGKKEDYLKPWTFTSSDGRFEMDFTPIIDRASNTDFKILKSDQHQVFGRFTGTAVLDDGTRIRLQDFMGFAEKVENKW